MKRILIVVLLAFQPFGASAETPEEWIAFGARVHGAFGAFIPLGIRIGLDAVNRLNAKPRELTVLYFAAVRFRGSCERVRPLLLHYFSGLKPPFSRSCLKQWCVSGNAR